MSTAEKVVALSGDFRSQRRLADLLGVSPAQVTRWRQGSGIDELNARRVDILELVMSSLLRLYSPEVAEFWLLGLNPHLADRRPIDLVRAGRWRDCWTRSRRSRPAAPMILGGSCRWPPAWRRSAPAERCGSRASCREPDATTIRSATAVCICPRARCRRSPR